MPQDTPADILKDAELLIAYVVRSGLATDQALIDTIIEARGKIAAGTLTPAEESAFYLAVNTLAAKLAPVSAESLRACSTEFGVTKKSLWMREPYKCSRARLAVRNQRRWALFALALLLITQIYWLIGSSLVSHIPALADSPVTATAAPGAPPDTAAAPDKAEEKNRLESAQATRVWLLRLWSVPWRWVPDLLKHFVPASELEMLNRRSDSMGWGYSAKEVLPILQIYALPLLYGWVGAMAYVLRRMIQAVRQMTYRGVLDVEFSLRVYLGVLSGVAIGWFFKPDTTNAAGGTVTLASLTPFALSFVAGYSVELLFTAMDRLVGAFTEKKSETTP